MERRILFFTVIIAFVIGISLSNANAISPFTEIGNLEAEVLDAFNMVADQINILSANQTAQQLQIDSLNTIQISELAEQDVIQADIINLQIDVNDLETQIFSNMQFFTQFIKVHTAGFNTQGAGNSTNTAVIRYTAYENVDVTVDFQYLESSRQFNNGTARSFQLLDDVVLLGVSKIFIETFIVPLGDFVQADLPTQIISSCLILPGDDPAICNKTTTLAPGEDIQVFFKIDAGGILLGMNSQLINTKVTALVTPISP